jgi:hypothetical protein
VIKLREGLPLEQIVDTQGRVSLLHGGEPLDTFDTLLSTTRVLRQSFPDYVSSMRNRRGQSAVGPNALSPHSLDLFLRLTLLDPADDDGSLLDDLRRIPEVEFARVVARASDQSPSPEDYAHPVLGKQAYLYRGFGVDAAYAWDVRVAFPGNSGTGDGVRVLVLDKDMCSAHVNLPPIEEPTWGSPPDPYGYQDQRHGAKVLGLLGAQNAGGGGTGGTIGLCPDARFHFTRAGSTDPQSVDNHAALQEALAAAENAGYDFTVVLLELQLDMPDTWMSDHPSFHSVDSSGRPVKGRGWIPLETNVDVLNLMANAATHRGITFVEPAGNTSGELGAIYPVTEWALAPADRSTIWDPATDLSGAVVVGAGDDRAERAGGAFGARVDCQAQGHGLYAPVCPAGELDAFDLPGGAPSGEGGSNQYTDAFGGTSAASAIIAGVVACLQGAHHAAHGAYLPPAEIRDLLGREVMGRPQSGDTSQHIGPRPDIYRILARKGVTPALMVRDRLEDDGSPQPSVPGESPMLWNRSPDVILSDTDDLFLADVPWATEIPSTRVGLGNVVYVRVGNFGLGPDEGTVRVWWSHPSSFLHPRWWNQMDARPSRMIGPGQNREYSARWTWSRFEPDLLHVALIGAVNPERNLDAAELGKDWSSMSVPVPQLPILPLDPNELAALTTDAFLQLSNQSRCFGARSVIWEDVRRGAGVSFRYHLRGIPESADDFVLALNHDLPSGTLVSIEPNQPIASTNVPGIDWDVGAGYSGALPTSNSAGFHLAANQEVVLDVTLTIPASVPRGTHELVLDQWWSTRHLGRFTLVLRVT